jgi:drug/metabolite transporter (DMT)-like permease
MKPHHKGYWLGALGVLTFSLTFPSMKVAVRELDPTFVGLGRALLAAIPAAALLLFTGQPLPKRRHLLPIALVAICAVAGFPILSAWALRRVDSSHASIVAGLMPLATAVIGSWRDRERHHPLFWLAAVLGSGLVALYSFISGDHHFSLPDIALFLAMMLAGVGYAEGARVGRELGSWQVICWALVFSVPFLIYPVYRAAVAHRLHAGVTAWIGFTYAGLFSMFLGYFAWYRGLNLGGIARISQIQLLQPFLSMAFSSLLLSESLTPLMIVSATLVCACVVITKRFASAPALAVSRNAVLEIE